MNRKSPPEGSAVARAVQALEGMVRSAAAGEWARLPPARQLCTAAGCSYVTVVQALHVLEQRGVVDVRRGRSGGVFLPGARLARPLSLPAPASRPFRWQRLATTLRRDILDGVWAEDAVLPACKELARRYGVAGKTLARALSRLREERFLVGPGRMLSVRALPRKAGATLVLIARGAGESGAPMLYAAHTPALLHALDNACARHALHLRTSLFAYRQSRLVGEYDWADRGNPLCRQHALIGFVVYQQGLGDVLIELCTNLAGFGLPVAVVDDAPPETAADLSRVPGSAVIAQVSAVDSYSAGLDMGRYLLTLGHRRVAYLSANHDTDWSQVRLQGLSAAFEDAGIRSAVRLFVASPAPLLADERLRSRQQLDARLAELLLGPATGDVIPDAGERRDALYRHVVRDILSSRLGMLPSWTVSHLPQIRTTVPLCRQALADREVTAWVCANDETAMTCRAVQVRRRVAVPDTLSLVGFDDTTDAVRARLTSYSFAPEVTVRAALGHILGSSGRSPRRPGFRRETTRGFVSARESSAKPPGT